HSCTRRGRTLRRDVAAPPARGSRVPRAICGYVRKDDPPSAAAIRPPIASDALRRGRQRVYDWDSSTCQIEAIVLSESFGTLSLRMRHFGPIAAPRSSILETALNFSGHALLRTTHPLASCSSRAGPFKVL